MADDDQYGKALNIVLSTFHGKEKNQNGLLGTHSF